MSKKRENQKLILNCLSQNNSYVEASKLASYLNVTRRTVVNYIIDINSNHKSKEPLILSSQYGYKLNFREYNSNELNHRASYNNREVLIINKLLKPNGKLDYFELASELCISESTLESDLTKVRSILKPFNMTLTINNFEISLNGNEKSKRKLMNNLLLKEDYHFFNSLETIAEIFPLYDIKDLQEIIYKTCSTYGLYLNDYALQNILIHLVITIDRIKNNNILLNDNDCINQKSLKNHITTKCAYEIVSTIKNKYNIEFIPTEISYLAIIIDSNSSSMNFETMSYNEIDKYICKDFIDVVENSLNIVCNYYYLDPFSEEFKLKFIIHVYNLYKRLQFNCTVINPLTDDIKNSYPFIFDIAILFSNELSKNFGFNINQNEIAYIGYHFGAYFENNKKQSSKLRCLFVSNSYYNLELVQIDKITEYFKDDIEVVEHCPFTRITIPYISSLNLDFIISVSPIKINIKTPIYIINQIITNKDLVFLKNKIADLSKQKKINNLILHINKFMNPTFFKKNFYKENYLSIIEDLCYEAKITGYIDDNFYPDVLKREGLYPTSFDDIVAIPHTLNIGAKKSFFSIIINDKKIKWGSNYANIIILVGINDKDLTSFRQIFDWLVGILTDKNNYSTLINSTDYNDFINNLIKLTPFYFY